MQRASESRSAASKLWQLPYCPKAPPFSRNPASFCTRRADRVDFDPCSGFGHVRCLRTFLTLNNLELHFVTFGKGLEA